MVSFALKVQHMDTMAFMHKNCQNKLLSVLPIEANQILELFFFRAVLIMEEVIGCYMKC